MTYKGLRQGRTLAGLTGIAYCSDIMSHLVSTIAIPTADEHPVRADVYTPPSAAGIVILAHGFKGYRTWGFLPALAERLAAAGLAALSIDFSLNGRDDDRRSAGPARPVYPRPDLFERNTLRRELADLQRVIAFIASNGVTGVGGPQPLGLYGHSRGGVAVINAALQGAPARALCTWSTTHDPDFYTSRQKARWQRQGRLEFVDARDGTALAIGLDYLRDLEENHTAYNLEQRVRALAVPHLIIHGTEDLAVDVSSARKLHAAESQLEDRRLLLVPAGHTFTVPYTAGTGAGSKPTKVLDLVIEETVDWFGFHLGRDRS